ncbi:UV DNA damage repair endonuclease UvsE [Mesotoga sp. BH458_6_3_2_1]|uniref:UV DNA damage repair endonuclease UvsE n=1 Tax=Mesotoga sp. BH458_6_3_2_1 TaxID=1437446 RepID=UPI000EF2450D|nr:UV DNA damage repair endonuclease UvsE [Mesotoga sp. BH458_6_3_2_1]RLL83770.1 UV damage repair endonuclease UvdE [Mesotoga sp. BH458_6_3_2_1]
MKIGYPCINTTLDCSSARSFRLASYSERRLIETVGANLACLEKIIDYNKTKNILFFRITSNLVPFASHPICKTDWVKFFRSDFENVGKKIRRYNMRVSMHPDQFVLLNSPKREVVDNSIAELEYHAKILDLMNLDRSAKIQIHVGGVYGEKEAAVSRFVDEYKGLSSEINDRLVIENDERLYSLADCLSIHHATNIPILLDVFHHSILDGGIDFADSLDLPRSTWSKEDGIPIVDYSTQENGARKGRHAQAIDLDHFNSFLIKSRPYDFDIMLEIKDKEKSAEVAISVANQDNRFIVN